MVNYRSILVDLDNKETTLDVRKLLREFTEANPQLKSRMLELDKIMVGYVEVRVAKTDSLSSQIP